MPEIYRCTRTRCSRNGYAFAFWWFAGGETTGEPAVWCPACKVPGTVVDSAGRSADPLAPPPEAKPRYTKASDDVYKAVTRALRAEMAGAGRVRHGAESAA